MGKKDDRLIGRIELADRLEDLAARLRAGELAVDGRRLRVPDTVEAKIGCKEKKGRIVFKLRWRWSTLADYTPDEQEAVIRWQDSIKSVKKRLGRSFADLRRTATGPDGPDSEIMAQFVADSHVFAQMAEPEWADGMQAYMDHLENLVRAADRGQVETVRHEIRDLGVQLKTCHSRFK